MTKDDAIERLKQYLSCWRQTDSQNLITPDFVWENHLPKNVPFGGSYCGFAGTRLYKAQLNDSWVTGSFDFRKFIYDADERTLVVIGEERDGRSIVTGRICNMPFVFEARFAEDGRLSFFREYNDTAAISATFDG